MKVDILSPDKKLFSGEASMVVLPGKDGRLGILNNHAPLITILREGVIRVEGTSNGAESFTVKGGVAEVLNNKVIILAE
jgi:F-type H+-transporting ATPase subunit epsilon